MAGLEEEYNGDVSLTRIQPKKDDRRSALVIACISGATQCPSAAWHEQLQRGGRVIEGDRVGGKNPPVTGCQKPVGKGEDGGMLKHNSESVAGKGEDRGTFEHDIDICFRGIFWSEKSLHITLQRAFLVGHNGCETSGCFPGHASRVLQVSELCKKPGFSLTTMVR
ncbi:hypothetical protein BDN67DRAFT_985581 [Paxillus ammoniavirescens]|nr:hypothetical protein BDN67DRAFT_985581 [Paxillus ammoniavirescens]